MSFCRMCGAELLPNAKFCSKCGTPVAVKEENAPQTVTEGVQNTTDSFEGKFVYSESPVTPQNAYAPNPNGAQNTQPAGAPVKKSNGGKIILIIAIVVVACAVLGVGGFFGYRYLVSKGNFGGRGADVTTLIDMGDCTRISFDGYNGEGTVKASIEYEKFCRAVYDSMDTTMDAASDEQKSIVNKLYYAIDIKPNVTSGLSNWDEVVITFKCDDEILKKAGVDFADNKMTVTVSGLPEYTRQDPFEYLSLTFTGVSGDASLYISNTSGEKPYADIYFEADKVSYINIGDVITVTIDDWYVELFKSEYGIILTKTSMQYTVTDSDISRYVDDLSELPQSFWTELKDGSVSAIEGEYQNYSDMDVQNISFVGAYFLKKTSGSGLDNGLFMVFTADVSLHGEEDTGDTYILQGAYIVTFVGDLLHDSDNGYTSDRDLQVIDDTTYVEEADRYIVGFSDKASVYDYCVDNNIRDYSYEVIGDLYDALHYEPDDGTGEEILYD